MTSPKKLLFVSVHVRAAADLDFLNGVVEDQEFGTGPLVEMKVDNDMTFLKFDSLSPSPPNAATISRQAGGEPKVPDGSELVVTGRIFIEGEQVLCAATRKS